MKNFIKEVFNEVVHIVATEKSNHIKWQDRNTLDQLLRTQQNSNTEHMLEFKKKMQSFLEVQLGISKKEVKLFAKGLDIDTSLI